MIKIKRVLEKGDYMKAITLEIIAEIIQNTGERQEINMTTEGSWYEKSGAYYLTYDESEMSGLEGSRTVLKIEGETVSLTRMGAHHSKMIFNLASPYNGEYNTPYGIFEMKIITQSLESKLDYEQVTGSITLKYEMILEATSQSVNTLKIKVRTAHVD